MAFCCLLQRGNLCTGLGDKDASSRNWNSVLQRGVHITNRCRPGNLPSGQQLGARPYSKLKPGSQATLNRRVHAVWDLRPDGLLPGAKRDQAAEVQKRHRLPSKSPSRLLASLARHVIVRLILTEIPTRLISAVFALAPSSLILLLGGVVGAAGREAGGSLSH